jgi:glycerol kinase
MQLSHCIGNGRRKLQAENMLILAIDQGTHSTRAIIFDDEGRVVSIARQSVTLNRKNRREVEQSADEIRQSMLTVIGEVLNDPAIDRKQIVAAGLATQRSSVLAWDRNTGRALSPVLSWQDRRVADTLLTLMDNDQNIRDRTGLHLSPHYGAGKLQWLLNHVPDVATALANDTLMMGPLAAYLLHHLTDSPDEAIDDANASRTLLWNLQQRDWDNSLLELFQIPAQVLPACTPICSDYGHTRQGNIPVRAVNGDQTAALYAQGKPSANTVLVNIGTGAFVLLPTDDPTTRPDGLLAGVSLSNGESAHYYVEGTVNGAAAALKWAASKFSVKDVESRLPGWLEEIRSPTLFMNTVGGLGAPWWTPGPEPCFVDTDIPEAEAMVAVIESILFLIQANIELMTRQNPGVDKIRISGGLSNLDGLCQKLANLSGLGVERPLQTEATARGIAWQAAGCPDEWPATGTSLLFTPDKNDLLAGRYAQFIKQLKQRLQ